MAYFTALLCLVRLGFVMAGPSSTTSAMGYTSAPDLLNNMAFIHSSESQSPAMSSTQLPHDILDRIQNHPIENEVVKVIQILDKEWVEETFLDDEEAAEMTEEEVEEFWANNPPPPSDYKLRDVRLVFSGNLRTLLEVEETRETLMELIYKHATVDLSEIKIYGREDYQVMLKEKLHCFRNVRVGLAMPTKALGAFFDHVDHLSLLAGGYQWPMKEDTSATIWARAKKSLFPLTSEGVVDVVRADAHATGEQAFRLVPDTERDVKAVTWAKSVNGLC